MVIKLGRKAIGIDINQDCFEIGLRRTGITTTYNNKDLIKDKSRKTTAKSKSAWWFMKQFIYDIISEEVTAEQTNYIFDKSPLIQYLDKKNAQ